MNFAGFCSCCGIFGGVYAVGKGEWVWAGLWFAYSLWCLLNWLGEKLRPLDVKPETSESGTIAK